MAFSALAKEQMRICVLFDDSEKILNALCFSKGFQTVFRLTPVKLPIGMRFPGAFQQPARDLVNHRNPGLP
jgi:hypothetical protein